MNFRMDNQIDYNKYPPQCSILHIENFPNLSEIQMNSPMDRLLYQNWFRMSLA